MSNKLFCNYPWTHFEVNNPNGDVTMCCDNQFVLGNVNKKSIMEIWNDKPYQNIRNRMHKEGAYSVCSSDCAVLKGFKSYQNLDWYKALNHSNPLYENAVLNDHEQMNGIVNLASKPRWMRFAYSYVCNLNCYHCYQEKTRKQNLSLPDHFIQELYNLADYYQVMFFYGGEPFLYKPTVELMQSDKLNPNCRRFFVTNATLLNDEIFSMLEKIPIGLCACSLDAASEKTYMELRKGGNWERVMKNIARISKMKKEKSFVFSLAMTLNSKNYSEMEDFCALAFSFDAEPMIALVNNPYGSLEFQKRYLHFTDKMISQITAKIDQLAPVIREKGFYDAALIWEHTKHRIFLHGKGENNLFKFFLKRKIYDFYCGAPDPVKKMARGIVRSIKKCRKEVV